MLTLFDPTAIDQYHLDGRRPATQEDITRLQRIAQAHGHLVNQLRNALTECEAMINGTYVDPTQLDGDDLATFMKVEDYRQLIENELDEDMQRLVLRQLATQTMKP